MYELAALLGLLIGLAADPILILAAGVAGARSRSRSMAAIAGAGVALAVELLTVAMTAGSPFGGYPFGRALMPRMAVGAALALAAYGLAVLIRRRRGEDARHG